MRISAVGRRASLLVLVVLAMGAAAPPPTVIGADVKLAPTRLVFNGRARTAQVWLSSTQPPMEFDVSLVDRTMVPDGRIVEDEPGGPARADSAKAMISVAPQHLRFGADAPQSISVVFRGGGPRQAGEYRTHLTLTPATPTAPLTPGASRMLLSYSIPVIVRLGPVDVRAGIGHIRSLRLSQVDGAAAQTGLPGDQPALSFDLQRLGANSVYGDVEVHSTTSQPEALLAAVRGVAVYPEVAARPIVLPLSRPLNGGEQVRLDYIDRDLHPGRVLASAGFTPSTAARYAAASISASNRARRVSTIARS
jgi:hypothetical protein